MKLKLKLPQDAIIKVLPELNNLLAIYNKKNDLEFILIPVKGGGKHGKD